MKNLLLKSTFFLFGILPQASLPTLSYLLGWILRTISPRRLAIVRKNIDIVYSHLGQQPAKHFIRDIYRHFALTIIEILRLPSKSIDDIRNETTLYGSEHIDRALTENKGVIAIASHLGNWEYSINTLAVNGYDSRIILKEQRGIDNDYVNEQIRGSKGITSIVKTTGFRNIMKCFKENAVIGMVIDQRAKTKEATKTEIFGLETTTFASPVAIALKTGAPIVTVHSYRDSQGHHHTIVGEPIAITNDPELTPAENISINTRKLQTWFEKVLLEHPKQWIWMHQRWNRNLYK